MGKRIVTREEAEKSLQLAQNGNAAAQYNIGLFYYRGLGVEKNLVEAEKWARRAAQQGLAAAQYSLGYYYVRQLSLDESTHWIEEASEQDFHPAQRYLSWLIFVGAAKKRNFITAFKWIILANRTHSNWQSRFYYHFLKMIMTKEQIDEGKRLAEKWLESRA